MNTRRLYWLAFLAGAGALAIIPELFFAEPEGSEALVQPVQRATAPRAVEVPAPAVAADLAAAKVESPVAALPVVDLFAPHHWRVAPVVSMAPPPVMAPPPPPKPSAPPMPFRFIGKLDDNQDVRVFLQRGEKLYTVRVGDVIDRTYRVDGIHEARMSLTYLPLSISQSLAVGSEP